MGNKRKPHPSQSELHETFFYDPETGLLHWKIRPSANIKWGDSAGAMQSSGYLQVGLKGERYYVHNLIWIYHYGEILAGLEVDHRDKDSVNNRLSNLRIASRGQQQLNKNVQGFTKRLDCNVNPWLMQHSSGGIRKRSSVYPTALQARLAYERVSSQSEPEFASTWLTDAVREFCSGGSPTVWMPG